MTDITRDNEGYLVNPDEWSVDIAALFAKEEDLELNEDSWIILNFMRDYYTEHKIVPDIRHAVKHLAHEKDTDKKTAKKRLFELFPYGYVKQACKISGMKRPRAWSTG
jgi:tRNA 2-thiouridine synthesizing protein E